MFAVFTLRYLLCITHLVLFRVKGEFAMGEFIDYYSLRSSELFNEFQAAASQLSLIDLDSFNDSQSKAFFISKFYFILYFLLAISFHSGNTFTYFFSINKYFKLSVLTTWNISSKMILFLVEKPFYFIKHLFIYSVFLVMYIVPS